MLASPRLPNKSHNTGIFIANKGISNHNKGNGKAMLKNWTKVKGEGQEHGRCIGVAHLPSRLPSRSIRSFVWDRHPSLISYNFSSGRPQCPLLRDLHLFELLKTVGVLDIVADERAAADHPWMRQHKAGPALLRLRPMCSTHAADGLRTKPNYHCWEFIIQMTSRGMCPWVGFFTIAKSLFYPEKWVTAGFLARWLYQY